MSLVPPTLVHGFSSWNNRRKAPGESRALRTGLVAAIECTTAFLNRQVIEDMVLGHADAV
jgi:hypothetical protein